MKCNLFYAIKPLIVFCFGLGSVLIGLPLAQGDIVLTALNTAVVDNFDSFRGAGFSASPTSGQLDSNTYRTRGFSDGDGAFGGTFASGDFARGQSTGAVTTGGAYAFEVAPGNFTVGVQPTGADFNPGDFTIRVRNETGAALTAFRLDGDAYFFNDENRSTNWTFAVSYDDSTYLDIFEFQSDEAADASPAWGTVPVGGLIPFIAPLADGERFYIRITGNDLAGSGGRDQFAIDNLAITGIPEPSSFAVLVLMMCPFLRVRSRRAIV